MPCSQVLLLLAGAVPVMCSLTPAQRAQELCDKMTLDEKVSLLHGTQGDYVGNVPAIERLEIPAISMNDGPQGFRDNASPGTTTCFPGGLTVGATWDRDLAAMWGQWMGQEFRNKGANVQLGPGVCLARVPRNGRNFEYISGEDPYLGHEMVQPAIGAIQSAGVVANAKHYALNNQETNRDSASANVDERTRFEMYYPPFAGAIKADVGSYNKINHVYSCENDETLRVDLKERLGFKGWVMSDWGATHSTSLPQGLDQEMPGGEYMGDALLNATRSGAVSMSAIDNAVRRVLTPLIKVGATGKNASHGDIKANVSTAEGMAAARTIAASAMVMLKNDGGLLPLSCGPNMSIVVIGKPASDPIVGGGGSGSVVPSRVTTPLAALTDKLKACGSKVEYFESDAEGGAEAAKSADAALLFVQTTSSEGADRANLSLGKSSTTYDQDHMITSIATASPGKTIVFCVSPGAILTPWREKVGAIIAAFMPGQEYGAAVVDVLFGKINPSARLPLTFPANEDDLNMTNSQYPGDDNGENTTYSEGLFVGYRFYDQYKVEPAFCFGHGLSYASFHYSDLRVTPAEVSCTVTNVGKVEGAEVAQLYLSFPTEAGNPPLVLRGFSKTMLAPGASANVRFSLDSEALSKWDSNAHGWVVVKGTFGAHVGASSRDIRLSGSFHVGSED